MKLSNLPATGLAIALAGSVMTASTSAQAPGSTSPAAKTATAHADIKGDGISGSVSLTERKQGTGVVVTYTIRVKGLTAGLHGVHLHEVGKCEPDFEAAGGHFDPGPAGNPEPDANHPFHMGDIPNLEARADGMAVLQGVTTRVTLSDGPLSLFDADGSAIIVHANPDKGTSGAPKSGVSGGPRVACGVFTKK
jgi:Cu-Zn family superoxide dismutase